MGRRSPLRARQEVGQRRAAAFKDCSRRCNLPGEVSNYLGSAAPGTSAVFRVVYRHDVHRQEPRKAGQKHVQTSAARGAEIHKVVDETTGNVWTYDYVPSDHGKQRSEILYELVYTRLHHDQYGAAGREGFD